MCTVVLNLNGETRVLTGRSITINSGTDCVPVQVFLFLFILVETVYNEFKMVNSSTTKKLLN